MTAPTRRLGYLVLLVVLALWVHAQQLGAGPSPDDLAYVAALLPEELPAAARAELPTVHAPLVRGLTLALRGLPCESDVAAFAASRGLQLVLLVLLGLGTGSLARAALGPWLGAEGAVWTGRAAALFVPLHPLSRVLVARHEALGVLCASLCGVVGASLFLAARQRDAHRRLPWAFALLVPAALASRSAAWFVLVYALLEYTSAQRHRPVARALRTALTTAVAAALCIGATWLVAGRPVLAASAQSAAFGWDELARALPLFGEKLLALFLPVAEDDLPRRVGLALVLALVVHPAVLAARAAPRMWAALCAALALALLSALALHPRVRVTPEHAPSALVLLPALLVFATLLAAAATPLAGRRRWVLPLVLVAAWAFIGRREAPEHADAARELAQWRLQLTREAERLGPAAELWVVRPEAGWSPGLERALPWSLHAGLRAPAAGAQAGGAPLHVRAADAGAVAQRLVDAQSATLRAAGWIVVFEPAPGAPLVGVRVAAFGRAAEVRSWRGEARSPELDAEPSGIAVLRVTARVGSATQAPPRVAWHAREPALAAAAADGVWIAGPQGPQAWFDLSRDLRWLCGRSIARLWFEGALALPASAEILATPAALEGLGAARVEGQDWIFAGAPPRLPEPLVGEARWRLVLCDPAALRCEVFEVLDSDSARLVATGAERFAAAARARGSPSIAWSLEYALGGATLARHSGHRVP